MSGSSSYKKLFNDVAIQRNGFDILNVEISENLKTVDGSHFTGQLIFDIMDREAAIIVTKKAQFSLRKMEKKFGEENLKIWEVFLDDIY